MQRRSLWIISISVLVAFCTLYCTTPPKDIFQAVKNGDMEALSRMLDDNPGLVNLQDSHGMLPLHLAIQNCDQEAAEILIFYGADVDARRNNDDTPIYLAIHCERVEMPVLVWENGANVNLPNKENVTALMRAARLGRKKAVKFLLYAGAEINVKDNNGRTPLDLAIEHGHHKIAKILVKRGAKRGPHQE